MFVEVNDLPHLEQLMGFLKVALFPVISDLSVLWLSSLLIIVWFFNADVHMQRLCICFDLLSENTTDCATNFQEG